MITNLAIASRAPLVGGAPFGASGAYDRIEGTATGTLDPAHPANRRIALLAMAPRNAAGLVEYKSDFVLLTPADPTLGNGRLLYEVNNRGRIMMIHNLCAGIQGHRPGPGCPYHPEPNQAHPGGIRQRHPPRHS